MIKLAVPELNTPEAEGRFRGALALRPEVKRVDVNIERGLARIAVRGDFDPIKCALVARGFSVSVIASPDARSGRGDLATDREIASSPDQGRVPRNDNEITCAIEGMSCRACEIKIEKAWRELPGVAKVDVSAATGKAKIVCASDCVPSLNILNAAIADFGYRATTDRRDQTSPQPSPSKERETKPSLIQLIGLFALVVILGKILSGLGWLRPGVALGAGTSVAAVFILGLTAASSSCLAVSGGLMLSTLARYRTKLLPTLMFASGRVAGYALFGAIIGGIGKALSPSPSTLGIITLFAALYMFVMGLEMLHIAPQWLRAIMPRMPKSLGHKILAQDGRAHKAMPAALGAATFFLPCGFTQALQLYALTTQSAVTSGLLLGAFALGTAPSLVALGWASHSLKGKFGTLFFRFSGALLVVLGFWNVQNGLTILGRPIALPSWQSSIGASASGGALLSRDPNVAFDGRVQTVALTVDYGGFTPAQFTLQSGVPARLNVGGPAAGEGCLSVLQIPKLRIQKRLAPGAVTSIDFTPTNPGRYVFSCSMGMFRGVFDVI